MKRWTWPNHPETARDLIAVFLRNWGRDLAYCEADRMIQFLANQGWVIQRDREAAFWIACGERPGWRSNPARAALEETK